MSKPEECPFCDVKDLSERIIEQGKLFISFLSNPRIKPGHSLVIPRRHIELPVGVHSNEALAITTEIQRLQSKILIGKTALSRGCDVWQKYQPFVPEGERKVNHLHFHVIPRDPEDGLFSTNPEAAEAQFVPLGQSELDEILPKLKPSNDV